MGYNCIIVDGIYQVEDITSPKVNQKYTDFPFVNYCSYSFDIYVSCINEYPGFPQITFQGIVEKPLFQNDTSAIYHTIQQVPVSQNYTMSINVTGCDTTSYIQYNALSIQLDCYEVPNDISIKSNPQIYYNSFIGYDHAYFNIEGLQYPLDFYTSDIVALGSGYYLFKATDGNVNNEASFYKTNKIMNSSLDLPLSSNGSLLSFQYYYSDSILNQVSEFNYYPDDLNNSKSFIQKSKMDFPVATFKLKSDVPIPLQFYISYRNKQSFYPLYGEADGTITYYSSIESTIQGEAVNVFFKNGDYAVSLYNLDYLFKNYETFKIPVFKSSATELNANIYNVKYNSTYNKINQDPFFTRVNFDKYNYDYYFPFGFSSGSLVNFYFEANFFTLPGIRLEFNEYHFDPPENDIDKIEPEVKDIQINYIGDRYVQIRVEASDVSGISRISYGEVNNFNIITHFGIETLASGTIYDGIFEVITEITYNFDIAEIMVYDAYDNRKIIERVLRVDNVDGVIRLLERDTIYSMNPIKKLKSWFNDNKLNLISNLTSITFENYQMDVNNKEGYNTVYFNFSNNYIQDLNFSFVVNYNPISIYDGGLMAKWDNVKKLYYVKFAITKNSMSGPLEWSITTYPDFKNYSSGFFSGKFNQVVINSSTPDLSGPFIRQLYKIPSNVEEPINISNDPLNAQIGWSLVIEDAVNGFSHGYVVVMGLVDGSRFNFTLNSDGYGDDTTLITFDILLNNISCIDQTFKIVDIVLFDSGGKYSVLKTTSYVSSDLSETFNPLIYYIGQNTSSINVTCTPVYQDLSGPELVGFIKDGKTVDVGISGRDIVCQIEVEDKESGINIGQPPIIYFTSLFFKKVECVTKLQSCESNKCKFSCLTDLPLAFAYPHPVWHQIYGVINKNGIFGGFSSDQIPYNSFNVSFSTSMPVITKTSKITNEGGDLYIIGRGLINTSYAIVEFNDKSRDPLHITPRVKSNNFIIININVINIGSFSVKTNDYSNKVNVIPIYVGEIKNSNSSNDSSSSTGSNNNNSKCGINKPLCGGVDKGYCTNEGCECIYPWTGVYCQYKTIIVPQPSFNNSVDPNIEIIVPPNNNSDQVEFTSLTSIIALRELDINKKAINKINFSNWLNLKVNSTLNEYYTNFTNINNSDKVTQVKVSVQWFSTKTNITFAGYDLVMNPSSIKYTIEIKDYPFVSKLNELQVVMSALFKSSDKDSCSSKEFIDDSNGFNSNYLTIRVKDHSLFARFIKRGIIDSNTIEVNNTVLDDSFNPIEESNSLQSFIGISIPNFQNVALIDPDYSIIMNYQSSSSSSICNNKSLSASKIAGIVIGCFAFVCVVSISIVYTIYKKRKQRNFIKNIDHKLKNIEK